MNSSLRAHPDLYPTTGSPDQTLAIRDPQKRGAECLFPLTLPCTVNIWGFGGIKSHEQCGTGCKQGEQGQQGLALALNNLEVCLGFKDGAIWPESSHGYAEVGTLTASEDW